jgi:Ca-activated chloride channel family protein
MRTLLALSLLALPALAQDAGSPALLNSLSLKRYDATVECRDGVATVAVSETFYNPDAGFAEADFVFPLPPTAAATGLALSMGGESFGGTLLRGDRARDIYDEITRRRRDPAILDCAGKDLYRCRVFPVPGHGDAEVSFSYRQPLEAEGAMRRLVVPLDAARFNRAPAEAFSLSVHIVAEKGLQAILCPTHDVEIRRESAREACLKLEGRGAYLARDLVVLYAEEDAPLGVVLASYRRVGEPGYFVLSIDAAFAREEQEKAPRDVVLAVDTSGSTGVYGLASAAAAVDAVTRALRPDDRYALLAFGTEPRLVADFRRPGEGEDARALLEAQPLAGRTRLSAAVRGATEVAERGRPGTGIILLTDGDDLDGATPAADAASSALGLGHRIGACGLGTAVDAATLDEIGERGGGDSAYGSERLSEDLQCLVASTRSVPITDVDVDVLGATDLCPSEIRMVQAGEAIVVAGRYTRAGTAQVRVRGKVAGKPVEMRIDATLPESGGDPAVARLWAARRIGQLLEEARRANDPARHEAEITRLGTRFGIVTPHTSLLVLEEGDQARFLKGMGRRPLLQSAGGEMVARPAHTGARTDLDVARRIRKLREARSGEANPFEDLLGKNRLRVQRAGDATFYRGDDGTWVESDLVGREPADPRVVRFLSAEWEELAKDPETAKALAVGRSVLFRLPDGTAVRVAEE